MKATLGTPSSTLVTNRDPGSPASEAFRVLRTNLQFLGLDKPVKTVLVTSASPGEGKSTTAANLAVTFAQAGVKVCLVDGDLRRPVVAKLFGADNWSGLTTALIGQTSLTECLRETTIPHLTILTSGPIPPNPAELLGSSRMTQLLAGLEDSFDIVIIDSPPVLAVTDAAVMAPKVDGVLMVIRSGVVARVQAARAKAALESVKARLLGAVLGAVPSKGNEGYYYYYYQSRDSGRGTRRL